MPTNLKYDDPTHSDIDEMWLEFKKAVQNATYSNIPSKRISGRKTNLPWITNSIRKMIRNIKSNQKILLGKYRINPLRRRR